MLMMRAGPSCVTLAGSIQASSVISWVKRQALTILVAGRSEVINVGSFSLSPRSDHVTPPSFIMRRWSGSLEPLTSRTCRPCPSLNSYNATRPLVTRVPSGGKSGEASSSSLLPLGNSWAPMSGCASRVMPQKSSSTSPLRRMPWSMAGELSTSL